MHLLQNVSSGLGCAFKANSSSPLTEIQFISGEPPNVRADVEKSDIIVCVGSSTDGDVEGCAADFKDIWKTILTARALSSNPKLLIFGAVCRLTQGLVVRKRFPVASEEFQKQRRRAESFLKYSDFSFLAVIILLLKFYLGWLSWCLALDFNFVLRIKYKLENNILNNPPVEMLLWLDSFQKPSLGMSGQGAGVCNTEMCSVLVSCYFIHFLLEFGEALPAGRPGMQFALLEAFPQMLLLSLSVVPLITKEV